MTTAQTHRKAYQRASCIVHDYLDTSVKIIIKCTSVTE